MSDQVWVTRIKRNYDFSFALRTKAMLTNDQPKKKAEILAMGQNGRGKPLPRSGFPSEEFLEKDPEKPAVIEGFPDFFFSGFTYVSGALAEVLSQFDLGGGSLYLAKLYQQDHRTLVPGEYFYLNTGTTKKTLLPEDSPGIEKSQFSSRSRIASVLKDDDLCLTQAALTDADLWIENGFWDELFLSDRLFQALQEAQLNVSFDAKRCRILS